MKKPIDLKKGTSIAESNLFFWLSEINNNSKKEFNIYKRNEGFFLGYKANNVILSISDYFEHYKDTMNVVQVLYKYIKANKI